MLLGSAGPYVPGMGSRMIAGGVGVLALVALCGCVADKQFRDEHTVESGVRSVTIDGGAGDVTINGSSTDGSIHVNVTSGTTNTSREGRTRSPVTRSRCAPRAAGDAWSTTR
jgi:hypothetical protein